LTTLVLENYFNKKDTEDINIDTAFEVKKMGKDAE
jgi:hypothetical protein